MSIAIDLSNTSMRNAFLLGLSLNGIPVPVETGGGATASTSVVWDNCTDYFDMLYNYSTVVMSFQVKNYGGIEVVAL